jgi:hypothetical protein
VKIDYAFDKILPKRADEPVYNRVDYTNLLGYWSKMTNSPASRMKRCMGEEGLTQEEWRNRVQRAASRDEGLRKRSEKPIEIRTARARLASAMRLIESLQPEHTQSFWGFAAASQVTMIGWRICWFALGN